MTINIKRRLPPPFFSPDSRSFTAKEIKEFAHINFEYFLGAYLHALLSRASLRK